MKEKIYTIPINDAFDENGECPICSFMKKEDKKPVTVPDKAYEDMTVQELQEAILEKMRKNGPVTDYMLGTVRENTHHGSLLNWVRSFR